MHGFDNHAYKEVYITLHSAWTVQHSLPSDTKKVGDILSAGKSCIIG